MPLRALPILIMAAAAAQGQFVRGVNLAGAEFGEAKIPGILNTDYTYNSEASFRYLGAKGMLLVRIPVRWERLQPVLSGPLDESNLNALKQNMSWAHKYGLKVVLDVHNYGRYKLWEGGELLEYALDKPSGGAVKVPGGALADLWYRLASEFKSEPAIYAYDLMNEPHDMAPANWKAISQMALGAIRGAGDQRLVMVPGEGWSAAHRWPEVHGPSGWISDPANNFAYEAHQYFDSDNSGTYKKSYDEELALNPDLPGIGRKRLAPFAEWCRANNARCYLGEYGVPGDDPRWLAVLEDFLAALDEAGMDGTYWAAGEWWGDDPIAVQPRSNFSEDRPQMAVLQAHPGRSGLTVVSAAGYAAGPVAPGSLAAAFGTRLTLLTERAAALPWPTTLAGMQLEFSDSAGRKASPPLLLVSPGQVNFLVPENASAGRAGVILISEKRVIAGGTVDVARVAPALFTANGDGQGVAAAQVVRVNAAGGQSVEAAARFEAAQGKFVPAPIAFGLPGERLILVLYGTGFRNIPTATLASLRIGTTPIPLLYAGPQPEVPGLDQINGELPRSLAGSGEQRVTLMVEGRPANIAVLGFR